MSYKEYLKHRREVPIILAIALAFGIWVCFASFDGYRIVYSIAFLVVLVIASSIFDYKCLTNEYKHIMQQNKDEEELYNNMTFDKLVEMLYENESIDFDLAGCPEDYDDEQTKQWLKDYIETLIQNEKKDD